MIRFIQLSITIQNFGVKRVRNTSLTIHPLIQKHYGVNSYIIFNLSEKTDSTQDCMNVKLVLISEDDFFRHINYDIKTSKSN